MGSNGLTSARHDVFNKELAKKYPESYDNSLNDEVVYCGTKQLTSPTEIEGMDAGKMVLSPTRTYAPIIKKILETHRAKIDGMVHCSGGAQTKVLHFVDSVHIIHDSLICQPLTRVVGDNLPTRPRCKHLATNTTGTTLSVVNGNKLT